MGARTGATTLAKTRTSTLAAPARNKARAAGVGGGLRGKHFIDQDEPPSGHRDFGVGRHPEIP
jgi:hypothetical protein